MKFILFIKLFIIGSVSSQQLINSSLSLLSIKTEVATNISLDDPCANIETTFRNVTESGEAVIL